MYFWSCYVFFLGLRCITHLRSHSHQPQKSGKVTHRLRDRLLKSHYLRRVWDTPKRWLGMGFLNHQQYGLLSLGWKEIGRGNKHRMMIITYEFVNLSQFYKWMTMMITMIMIRTCHCCKAPYPKESCTICWNYSDHKIQPHVGKSILYSVNFGFINAH